MKGLIVFIKLVIVMILRNSSLKMLKKKKIPPPAIGIDTKGKTMTLTFNEKMIIKAGTIKLDFSNDIPNVIIEDWFIGSKRKKRFLLFKRKYGNGIEITGDGLIISGKSEQRVVVHNKEE